MAAAAAISGPLGPIAVPMKRTVGVTAKGNPSRDKGELPSHSRRMAASNRP
jgi:hypothetical protein